MSTPDGISLGNNLLSVLPTPQMMSKWTGIIMGMI